MQNGTIRLTRQELYDLVWAEPMRTVAQRLGISDVGLAKNCRKMKIPFPGRGHWAKKAAGKLVTQELLPPLPPNGGMTRREISFSPSLATAVIPYEPPPLPEPVAAQAAFEADPANRIVVGAKLRSMHALVERTIASFQAEARRIEGDWSNKPQPRLDIDVSKQQRGRAMRIADALVKAFEARDWKVVLVKGGERSNYKSVVTILGSSFNFSISETKIRIRIPAAAASLEGSNVAKARVSLTATQPPYREGSSGCLALICRDKSEEGHAERWLESETEPLDGQLNRVMSRLVAVACERAERHRQQLAKWKADSDARERRNEIDRLAQVEKGRALALEQQAQRWMASRSILDYIAAVRAAAHAQAIAIDPASPLAEWLEWADVHARSLDPIELPLEQLPLLLPARTDVEPRSGAVRIEYLPAPFRGFSRR